jgi:cytochrome bd-type quinol oxidase subunit 2
MKSPLAAIVAIAVGIILLVGFFVTIPAVQQVRAVMLGWGVILAGVATLVGIFHLVGVHWRKTRGDKKDRYSGIFLIAFFATLAAGLWLTPVDPNFHHIVTSIQVPVETSLLALLAVSLAFASVRLLQRRRDMMSVVFVVSVVFFLLLAAGIFGQVPNGPAGGGLLDAFNRLPMAGARGILLGVALGSVTTGLRILLGADRPYSG